MKHFFTFIVFLGSLIPAVAQTSHVLFIGNSYTGVNDLPEMTRQLALSLGDTLVVSSSSPGGVTFQGHTTNPTTQNLIDQGGWDHVVLQEQSQLPSFPQGQVASDCYPYATILVDDIRTHSPCAEAVFYMTWGRENGDADNCAFWPPVCTYEGMQAQLRISYLQMAQDNNAACAPAGMVWKRVREEFPAIGLYASDGSHPSVAGSYLVACTMYTTFFRRSTVGATFTSTLDATIAATLQQAASSVVLDSLSTWNIGVNDPVALPEYADLGYGQVTFSESSTNTTSNFWDLGDGSTRTESSFTHSYGSNGDYTVTYIAMDDCGRSDTSIFSIPGIVVGIQEQQGTGFHVTSDAQGLSIYNSGDAGSLQLFDLQGRLLRSERMEARSSQRFSMPSGLCVLWRFSSEMVLKSGIVVVP
ncbi:MAG: PKD domain-containing protein [Flavobacteriales bacterium]